MNVTSASLPTDSYYYSTHNLTLMIPPLLRLERGWRKIFVHDRHDTHCTSAFIFCNYVHSTRCFTAVEEWKEI